MDLFGTAGIRGNVETRVTPALALAVGQAVGEDGGEFVLGRDGRVTGPALTAAMEAGLESAGADVRSLGEVPTPTVAFASRDRRGVVITASHNPPHDNGIKLFVDGVEYDAAAERRIAERVADEPSPTAWSEWGERESLDVLSAYRDAVETYATKHDLAPSHPAADPDGSRSNRPLDGVSIAVDCGNGMASLATPQVLGALGARVVTLNGSVDGFFPGRPSKPTPETVGDLRSFVAGGDFTLGIAHDGDADRIVVVAPDGSIVHEDTVVAILAEHYVRKAESPDPVVVTTPNASGRIDERVDVAGGRTERVHLGGLHEGIERVRAASGSVVFAAEPWKHVHPDFGDWIDGVASAAVLSMLAASADGLAPLRDPVPERPYRKVNVECPEERKRDAMATIEVTLPEKFPDAAVDTEYGVRLDFDDGSWVLVRPSGTEPYLRMYAESDDVEDFVDRIHPVVVAAVEGAE
ncbi:phosphohexomutase domain-containing protein [Halanaeroarchaeum sulfurireducens]|uniref:Phosphomannomutase n=1 Tax=Halanaeroarchaeum sulfurireducens TaxID=1604004 RepID=A0A0F7PCR3_9EURY|nr:phosphomannomutase [Halanaeroarchaeum sulfurireducens]AKH97970.1 phosphomannomutase [Halanaeroarchaeum sulfurireducens]ALG82364.1 phosphomannomutase [Halanaeroarchaeum sulfurireducens]